MVPWENFFQRLAQVADEGMVQRVGIDGGLPVVAREEVEQALEVLLDGEDGAGAGAAGTAEEISDAEAHTRCEVWGARCQAGGVAPTLSFPTRCRSCCCGR